MQLSTEERRALGIIAALLVLAAGARWLERPRPLLEGAVAELDLAALERDSRAAQEVAARPPATPQDRVDPNRADAVDLMRLPGVGAAMAARIIAERDSAPFTSTPDLQRVQGIGPATAARLAPLVTLPDQVPAFAGSASGDAAGVSAGQPASGPAGPVDLNRATDLELQSVPGIGPVLAARLLARRDSLRGFRDWSEVDAVTGVGPALLARLKVLTVLR